ncbi:hypothetical protein Tco_1181384 [Tanacetum coccineum]
MKRVMCARFLLVDYEQMLYSLYQNCRQSSQTVTEYAEEFMRLASRNQLRESDAQQVVRFNNSLRYDIQAIVSLQTTWSIDEAVHIALKDEQTIKKQGIGSFMYKTKTDTNQKSSSQPGGDAQVDHSNSAHEVDGGKKTTTSTTSTHAINKSSINPYAHPRVNRVEGDKRHSESEDEGLIISPNAVFKDDDDHSEAFLGLVRRLVLTSTKKSEDNQRHNIFKHDARLTKMCSTLLLTGELLERNTLQSDLNVVHKGKENTYTFSKGGRKFTLCLYSDEVQATTTKEKKNQITLCSTRNKEKNICATTIPPYKLLNPIMNSWSSSFQEEENDRGPKLKKEIKDNPGRIKLD